MDPTVTYKGDTENIRELAESLGTSLFPVGYESSEAGFILVDATGRFFLLHHTGGYFLGFDEHDAFKRFLNNVSAPDAEDFFV